MRRYRMKAVSRLTGVRPELLRMWEKRYHLFKPHRAGNRYREFDDEDVQLLLYIRQQIDQGRTIGELAAEGREALLRQSAPEHTKQTQHVYADLIDELLNYIQRLDKTRLETRLAECVAHYTFGVTLNLILVPLMHQLGERWAERTLSIASEHFATMLLKQRLLTMLQATAPGANSAVLLCACPPGEFHELGLLTFAYTMQQNGWQLCYLGPDLPVRELYRGCQHLQPALVALSFTHVTDTSDCLETLQELDTSLAPSYPTVVGGQAVGRLQHLFHPRYLWFSDAPQAALSHVQHRQNRVAMEDSTVSTLGKCAIPQ